ncbi:peptide deformylase [Microbacterium memoriense]|uniref:Peptide deformylase n=1 Tax=Microbacterium memoriense TaxID=2978350 RepID=A0ABT2PAP6_9MICO|nr:peptide deformylase [Microbacterium memoriense]MCT9001103.1 peptide deformylase [Microbacterium memoriense]
MPVRPIRLFGDPVLRAPSAPIDVVDDGIRALVRDLLDSVEPAGRAGVAAPQIGVGLRAFSYNIDGDIGYVLNPVLVDVSGEPQPVGEGCLSVPGLWHDAIRYPWAKVIGTDLEGNEVVLEGEGLLAQALQHETDHLDGKLYLDRLPADTRRQAMREIRESSWF